MKDILWITGRLPLPLFSGDALYTAGTVRALAMRGARVTVVGSYRHASHVGKAPDGISGVEWVGASPTKRLGILSLLTGLPRSAYVLASRELCGTLRRLLTKRWDWIVIDHASSAGVLPLVLSARKSARVCYVAHNVEAVVRPEIARSYRSMFRRWAMVLDALKYRRLERNIVKMSDAVIAITADDAAYFAKHHANVHVVPPAFLGEDVRVREIDSGTPKSLLLVGSFEWGAKQRNLGQIVRVLQPALAAAGITLSVAGTVPPWLKARLGAGRTHLEFRGSVVNITDLALASRGGLVAEIFGGGFKLKILDYAFARLPIFGLDQAMTGMTSEERSAMFLATSLEELGDVIIRRFENIEELNGQQEKLHQLVATRFSLDHVAKCVGQVFEND